MEPPFQLELPSPSESTQIAAILHSHMVLISALISTHPKPKELFSTFSTLMSAAIERMKDPAVSGMLMSYEKQLRVLLKLRAGSPGGSGTPASGDQ